MTIPTWYVNNLDIALARIMIYVYGNAPLIRTSLLDRCPQNVIADAIVTMEPKYT